jgi:molybdate transport system substrate-binding protein
VAGHRFVIASATLSLLLGGCGGVGSQSSTASSGDRPSGTLTVLAAASLTDAFDKAGPQLEASHPQLHVRFSYASSQALVTQIEEGAAADVFASADQGNMLKVVQAGLTSEQPRVFARNRLEIVVQSGNPRQIRTLADLAQPTVRVDLCSPGVPCGTYAASALKKAGTQVTPVSQEENVKAVVTKVALGEADAGIAYATDVKAGGASVQGVEIPDDHNIIASYPIVRLKAGHNRTAANAFISFVSSSAGQKTLAEFGFRGPS